MREFKVTVEKLTDEEMMRKACECTFLGKSKQSLLSIYKTEHSPVRTQIFWVKIENLPLAAATHLIRHHVGSTPFQLSCRPDRHGGNQSVPEKCNEAITLLHAVESSDDRKATIQHLISIITDLRDNSDRNTPVNLGLLVNAQSLIDMSKLRLCNQAQSETRIIFESIKKAIGEVDPDLAKMMVRKCVYRGGICGEAHCCRFNQSGQFKNELADYLEHFRALTIPDHLRELRRFRTKQAPEQQVDRQMTIDWDAAENAMDRVDNSFSRKEC